MPTPPRLLHPYSRTTAADMAKTLNGFRPRVLTRLSRQASPTPPLRSAPAI